MSMQYSDSPAPLLAIDTASPRISVAVGWAGREPVRREAASGRSSPSLLGLIDEVLEEAGLRASELGGLVGVRGPGSFTGLRVGLSTLLGLHRALGTRATAVPTFDVLAWQARDRAETVLAVVDALRGEWFTQLFRSGNQAAAPEAVEEPILRCPDELAASRAAIVGFGLSAVETVLSEAGGAADREPPLPQLIEAEPLAESLLELAGAGGVPWDPVRLTEPLYLRPAATTPPKRPRVPGRA